MQSPCIRCNFSNKIRSSGLVRESASWLEDSQYSSWTSLDCTAFLNKWYCRSICSLRSFIDVLFAVSMVPSLSTLICTVEGFSWFSRSDNNRVSQIDSLVGRHGAMFSASQVEVATYVCFLDLHDTAPPGTRNIAPLVGLRETLQPPQSVSENPSMTNGFYTLYEIS